MNIRFQSSVIITTNFETMKAFYHDILEQEIEFDFGNCLGFKGGLTIWELKSDYPITRHLNRSYHSSGNKNLEICFESDSFEDVVAGLEKYDIKYLHSVTEEKWGQRTIRFYDPEDNLIEIGESMPCFVKRFYQQGMRADEIAKRTSIPIELVNEYLEK